MTDIHNEQKVLQETGVYYLADNSLQYSFLIGHIN